MSTTRKRIILSFVAVCLCFIFVELGLRFVGLHELPLYEASDNYEYRFAPNQSCCIFGKKLIVNDLGLRGELPTNKSDPIVWYCGDSVINGGIHTHEDSLATAIWDKHAENLFDSSIATLNVSQGSWGPENTFRFCKQHSEDLGNPNLIVLAVSSHDWNDRMNFRYNGHSKNKPTCNLGAIGNVLNKYFGNTNTCVHQAQADTFPNGTEFNQWEQYSTELSAQMVLYLHPTIEEIRTGTYNSQGANILTWAGINEVLVCKGLDILTENDFRDNIHLNERGQRQLSNLWANCFEFPVDTKTAR